MYLTYYVVGDAANANNRATHADWRGVTAATADVLTLMAMVDKASRALFDFAHGLTAPEQMLTFVDGASIDGRFHGIPGTFACSASCTISSDKDGNLSALGGQDGTWTFTPEKLADGADPYMVAAVKLDLDYLDFGYWVQTTTADGETTYMVDTFFRGEDKYESVTEVDGTAQYVGAAGGLYSRSEDVPTGDGDVLDAGRFTANATLTAHFGQTADDAVTESLLYSISGMITDFLDSDGNPIDANWRVTLRKIQGDNNDIGNNGAFSGTTTPGGTWNGQFYGAPGANNAQPTGVAGEFDAEFNNGDVIGAFGAVKQ